MVFQDYALYPHMTVFENMAFSLRYRQLPAPRAAAASRTARILGHRPLLEPQSGQLSGGQRQRVAMARAIVREPTVFLFDEPLSNLDAKLRVQMRTEIEAAERQGHDHDLRDARPGRGDDPGRPDRRHEPWPIEQIGTPEDVYDTPASTFVAGFIGPAHESPAGRGAAGRAADHPSRPAGGRAARAPGLARR